MLHFIPSPILGTITATLTILNTLLWAVPLILTAIVKFIIPIPAWRRFCVTLLTNMVWLWMHLNHLTMWLFLQLEWDISGFEETSTQRSYLVSSNHQTWLDIPVLFRVLYDNTPIPRFFLKQELIWVPVVGQVTWGLDMPFMKRYSKAFLKKHPELRGKDLETTRKAVEKYKGIPVAILNFLEGTRFTPEKCLRQGSPYQHLLQPKAGGFAFVMGAMGEQFDSLLDVTIIYPNAQSPSLWKFMNGQVPRIIIRARQVDIPPALLQGDYMNDPVFKEEFQAWVRALWTEKDAVIEYALNE